jgi:hypothetical protein
VLQSASKVWHLPRFKSSSEPGRSKVHLDIPAEVDLSMSGQPRLGTQATPKGAQQAGRSRQLPLAAQ